MWYFREKNAGKLYKIMKKNSKYWRRKGHELKIFIRKHKRNFFFISCYVVVAFIFTFLFLDGLVFRYNKYLILLNQAQHPLPVRHVPYQKIGQTTKNSTDIKSPRKGMDTMGRTAGSVYRKRENTSKYRLKQQGGDKNGRQAQQRNKDVKDIKDSRPSLDLYIPYQRKLKQTHRFLTQKKGMIEHLTAKFFLKSSSSIVQPLPMEVVEKSNNDFQTKTKRDVNQTYYNCCKREHLIDKNGHNGHHSYQLPSTKTLALITGNLSISHQSGKTRRNETSSQLLQLKRGTLNDLLHSNIHLNGVRNSSNLWTLNPLQMRNVSNKTHASLDPDPQIKDRRKKTLELLVYKNPAGRFGNQLFQYASLYGISRANGRTPVISPDFSLADIFDHLSIQMESVSSLYAFHDVEEWSYAKYDIKMEDLPKHHIQLNGFLQSWKYFQNYEKELRQQLLFKPYILRQALKYHDDIKKQLFNENATVIGIHIRRADLLDLKARQSGYQTPNETFLYSAMQFFNDQYDNIHFIVCSEPDGISWARLKLKKWKNISYSEGQHYSVDFAILSLCDHVIMTVGTFGWWAGWLSGGQVVYYSDPMRNSTELGQNFSPIDFFLPSWIGLP